MLDVKRISNENYTPGAIQAGCSREGSFAGLATVQRAHAAASNWRMGGSACHRRFSRSRMLSRLASLRMTATRATLDGLPRLGRGRIKALEAAEAGEHGGIDAVVLGELAEGLGEAARAQRIDQDGLDGGIKEALVEVAVVASGGFEDRAGDAVLEQPVAQGAAAALVVVEPAFEAALENVGVKFRFAGIDAGDHDRIGYRHSCVPVLLRFGAVPTLSCRSRRN